MVERRISITSISKVFETQSRPVVVTCDDYLDYICKYGKPHDLFNEYIAASFCQILQIPIPPFSFVKILPEHVINGIPKRHFQIPCFGSLYLPYAEDLTHFFLTKEKNRFEINKIGNKEDIVKIGLFDIWLSNEDRHHNHSNILIDPRDDGSYFIAIDHTSIFNSGNLDKELYGINEYESILTSDYIKVLFRRKTNIAKALDEMIADFYIRVATCKDRLPIILQSVPPEWNLNLKEKQQQMEQIFLADWLQESEGNCRRYLAQTLS